ncbi:P-loop NTPase family protein [[Clostridium] fimetarium]|uniref:Chromosome partitioning ATPase, Mrp family, contains Fe-S cluster n=1 Tax=[Clostridium] fimetarium TaxID=99656 RepID=A0A1I0LZH0_9FIRM|nr:hypothetical protein [[Clostridium] fimetarium]SEV81380.1 Chromosome partitioning ATPase, Mrp family, contains Fe-S cluster [[Clostridium] fimetarium]
MFSVNIDTLVSMTPKEETAYQELCNRILAKGRKFKTIAAIGENGIALKLADTIRKSENNVLFIDADFSTSVFMNKYKLGKNLKGISDYFAGSELPDKIICVTNKEDINVVFTGDVDNYSVLEQNEIAFCKLMDLYKNDYDYIILEVGSGIDIAKLCDGALLIMNNDDYSQKKAKKEVNGLSSEGCLILGVVINNV